jgi:hypothetical protein
LEGFQASYDGASGKFPWNGQNCPFVSTEQWKLKKKMVETLKVSTKSMETIKIQWKVIQEEES